MTVIYDPQFNWIQLSNAGNSLYYKGHPDLPLRVFEALESISTDDINKQLEKIDDFSTAIIETPNQIIAWVDHIRSWPLFYTQHGDNFQITNNPRKLTSKEAPDPLSGLEFIMSGYISGKRTLYNDIHCLQPGEFLVWNKTSKSLSLTRYHQYLPDMTDTTQDRSENMKKMGEILDDLTQKMIGRANNRPIWIPLSGGLDSRILLCKLHEHGYKNLHTFTYGPHLNFESRIAKKVAQTLNVPWHFISPSRKEIRNYFTSQERKDFWDNTDGLKAIPSMREFSALMHLRHKKLLPDDAIFVNGQSGDYITGNHIAKEWLKDKEFSGDDLFNVLMNKHYDLWNKLRTEENHKAIQKRMIEILPENWQEAKTKEDWATLEEIWEYDARQICLVANGQKSYDFFGYDWEMPLWEKQLVDFCETLPFEQKFGQALYKEYLQDYNYKGLFPAKEPYIWRWPVLMLWVVPAAQLVGLLKGRKGKDNFYALMRYHGHYSNQFYSHDWDAHHKTYQDARNVMSLNVRQWAIENRDLVPRNLSEALAVDHVD